MRVVETSLAQGRSVLLQIFGGLAFSGALPKGLSRSIDRIEGIAPGELRLDRGVAAAAGKTRFRGVRCNNQFPCRSA
jgi:hypothetical protein